MRLVFLGSALAHHRLFMRGGPRPTLRGPVAGRFPPVGVVQAGSGLQQGRRTANQSPSRRPTPRARLPSHATRTRSPPGQPSPRQRSCRPADAPGRCYSIVDRRRRGIEAGPDHRPIHRDSAKGSTSRQTPPLRRSPVVPRSDRPRTSPRARFRPLVSRPSPWPH